MGILPALCGYLASVILLHSLMCHLLKSGTAFLKLLVAGTIIGVYLLYSSFATYGFSLEALSLIFSYAFCCELYIFLFTFIASSISVSILIRVGNGEANLNQLATHYTGQLMVANRLRRLQDIAMLESDGRCLQITQRGKQLVNKFTNLRKLFKLPSLYPEQNNI